MKTEKLLAFFYTVLGICAGIVSNFFTKIGYGLEINFIFPLIVYLISLFFLKRFVKQKKKGWLFSNTFITFILVWLVIWILLYNL